MAVYTRVEFAELAELIAPLQLGQLVAAEGIAAGIENTTYFLTFAAPDQPAAQQQFVLTIAESIARADIEFVAQLTSALSRNGLPVPSPLADGCGERVLSVRNKPALLIPRAAGSHPKHPTPAQCGVIGDAVARCHLVTLGAGFAHESHRGLHWVEAAGTKLLPQLDESDRALLAHELAALHKFVNTHTELLQTVIHGDLFRDNALFIGDELSAIIDFFSAGNGYPLFDLAVIANDWCFRNDAAASAQCQHALVSGYSAVRPPTSIEQQLWPQFLALAALRFWVSRLVDGKTNPTKNPDEYRQLLVRHRQTPVPWPL